MISPMRKMEPVMTITWSEGACVRARLSASLTDGSATIFAPVCEPAFCSYLTAEARGMGSRGRGRLHLEASGPVSFANALLELAGRDFEAEPREFFGGSDGQRDVAILMAARERGVHEDFFAKYGQGIAVASGRGRDV